MPLWSGYRVRGSVVAGQVSTSTSKLRRSSVGPGLTFRRWRTYDRRPEPSRESTGRSSPVRVQWWLLVSGRASNLPHVECSRNAPVTPLRLNDRTRYAGSAFTRRAYTICRQDSSSGTVRAVPPGPERPELTSARTIRAKACRPLPRQSTLVVIVQLVGQSEATNVVGVGNLIIQGARRR
jgi:hypothetical protein